MRRERENAPISTRPTAARPAGRHPWRSVAGVLAAAIALAASVAAQEWTPHSTLRASDGEEGDLFGGYASGLAVSGDLALVNAVQVGDLANRGAVYPFHREDGQWVQDPRLTDPTADPSSFFFGSQVDILRCSHHPQPLAVITVPTFLGKALIYQFDGAQWAPIADQPSPGDAIFYGLGAAALLHDPDRGDLLAVGCIYHGDEPVRGSGAVHLYRESGGQWTEEALLRSPAPTLDSHFGYTLNLTLTNAGDEVLSVAEPLHDGDPAVCGSPPDTSCATGRAHVFRLKPADTDWGLDATFDPPAPSWRQWFGARVLVHEDLAFVTAPGFDDPDVCGTPADVDCNTGGLWLYRHDGTEWLTDPESAVQLSVSTLAAGDGLGDDLALSEDTLFVTASSHDDGRGAVHLLRRLGDAWAPNENEPPILGPGYDNDHPPQAGDTFGALGLDGDVALIGAPYADTDHGVDAGYFTIWVIPAATSESGVPITLADTTTSNQSAVTLTFQGSITRAGVSEATSSPEGPPPPGNFKLGEPPLWYDIRTSADFSGDVEVCIDYSGVSFDDESAIQMVHYDEFDNPTTLDVSFHDPDADIYCALTSSFSVFALVESIDVDSDGDGWLDGDDNCPDQWNPNQRDHDGDGFGNPCDPCPNDAANDGDGDGWCAGEDNCPETANPGQEDADGDEFGDACDECPEDPDNDGDGDGLCAGEDNCPDHPNPDQADSNDDGVGDPCTEE